MVASVELRVPDVNFGGRIRVAANPPTQDRFVAWSVPLRGARLKFDCDHLAEAGFSGWGDQAESCRRFEVERTR